LKWISQVILKTEENYLTNSLFNFSKERDNGLSFLLKRQVSIMLEENNFPFFGNKRREIVEILEISLK